MKTKRLLYLRIMVTIGALIVSSAMRVYAEAPRDELTHAYVLLKLAKSDYKGHRAAALQELETAGHELGLDLKGHGTEPESQMKSDALVAESSRMLHEASNKLEARDRQHIASHLDKAIHELDEALRVK